MKAPNNLEKLSPKQLLQLQAILDRQAEEKDTV